MLHKSLRIMLAPGLLMALLIIVALAGCGASASGGGLYGSGGNSGNTPSSGGAGSAQTICASSTAAICTRTAQVKGKSEQVLVTPSGKTLYYFTPDTATTSACSGGCATNWPPLLSSSASVPAIAGLSGTLTSLSRNGGNQIVYNGHPLYTFAADSAPGDVNGEGVNGKWFVATPDLAPASGTNSGY